MREDDTVEQYETAVTVSGNGTAGETGIVSVNHPLSLHGMKLYQNSTGWAANVQIFKGNELLQEGVICAGEYALVEDMEGLAVVLNAFYPDYVRGADGMPMTASPALNHPGYLYTLYYHDQILGMNVLTEDEIITVEDYGIRFTDPQQYTLIQVKRDPFMPLADCWSCLRWYWPFICRRRKSGLFKEKTEPGRWQERAGRPGPISLRSWRNTVQNPRWVLRVVRRRGRNKSIMERRRTTGQEQLKP